MNDNLLELSTLDDVRSFQSKLKEEKLLQSVGTLSKQISASRIIPQEFSAVNSSDIDSQIHNESILHQVGNLSRQISASRSTPLSQEYMPLDPETLECVSKTEYEHAIQAEKDILSIITAFHSTQLSQEYKPLDPETLEYVDESQLISETSVLLQVGALSRQISASRSTPLSHEYNSFYSETDS